MEEYLKDTVFLDYKNPNFDIFLYDMDPYLPKKELATILYYKVRDAFLYDPYHLDLTESGLTASNVLGKKRAWCVEKSSVLAAAARKFGIPSRLGYAIVTNHIGVEKLSQYLRREEIVFHGFVELFIEGKWVKCTPAFDQRICRVSGVSALDWDGEHDSLFQEFDHGRKFMEYLYFYGMFDDVPIELMNAEMKKYYPHLFEEVYDSKEFSFKHL
ncbi:MAG: transglutaminase-like domain-containing protein [Flavobacteriia bacterium]|jgi:transglutaminase-like putative cysteine protease